MSIETDFSLFDILNIAVKNIKEATSNMFKEVRENMLCLREYMLEITEQIFKRNIEIFFFQKDIMELKRR